MQEFAIYSVIPPEGCAAILWRDPSKKVEAAAALKLTAPDLLKTGIIDEIIAEPIGGAHTDPTAAAHLVDAAILRALVEAAATDSETRLQRRYEKFRNMGRDFVGHDPSPTTRRPGALDVGSDDDQLGEA
jgi:acetyl-CoA carboxylase carboxyl transferase subunit alpha